MQSRRSIQKASPELMFKLGGVYPLYFFPYLKNFFIMKNFKDVQEFSWGSPSEAMITIFHCTFSAYIKKLFSPKRSFKENSSFSLGRFHLTRIFLNKCASLEINQSCLL